MMDKAVKDHVSVLLSKRDFETLATLSGSDRSYWHELRFRLYDLNDAIRWAAIEAVAMVIQRWWHSGQEEKVKNYIRTLFWSLNDESGGIGWSSAQTIAEIISQIPELADTYASLVIAHTLDEPPLVKGGLWGIGRMGELACDAVKFFWGKVLKVFQSDDAETLGLAAWAMGEVGLKEALPYLWSLRDNNATVQIYIKGVFIKQTVGKWASDSVQSVTGKNQK